jgi:hypothetical protein
MKIETGTSTVPAYTGTLIYQYRYHVVTKSFKRQKSNPPVSVLDRMSLFDIELYQACTLNTVYTTDSGGENRFFLLARWSENTGID